MENFNNDLLWDILLAHAGHHVYVAAYGDPDDPEDVALECEDSGEVLFDAGLYTLAARNDLDDAE